MTYHVSETEPPRPRVPCFLGMTCSFRCMLESKHGKYSCWRASADIDGIGVDTQCRILVWSTMNTTIVLLQTEHLRWRSSWSTADLLSRWSTTPSFIGILQSKVWMLCFEDFPMPRISDASCASNFLRVRSLLLLGCLFIIQGLTWMPFLEFSRLTGTRGVSYGQVLREGLWTSSTNCAEAVRGRWWILH
jgi:hypothetical protein